MWNMLFVYNKLQLLVLAFTNLATFRTVYLVTQETSRFIFLNSNIGLEIDLNAVLYNFLYLENLKLILTNEKQKLDCVAFESFIR